MEFQEQLVAILQTTILGLLNIGAGYLIYYIKQLADKAKLKNESNANLEQKTLIDNAIDRLNALVEKSVIATNETLAKSIKEGLADGTTNKEELLSLKNSVIEDVKNQLTEDGSNLISSEIDDLNAYIANQIEVTLTNLKTK